MINTIKQALQTMKYKRKAAHAIRKAHRTTNPLECTYQHQRYVYYSTKLMDMGGDE